MNNNLNEEGFFGTYGGSFIPAELKKETDKIAAVYKELKNSEEFIKELSYIRKHYQGRPTPVTLAKGLNKITGDAKILRLLHWKHKKTNRCFSII